MQTEKNAQWRIYVVDCKVKPLNVKGYQQFITHFICIFLLFTNKKFHNLLHSHSLGRHVFSCDIFGTRTVQIKM